MCVRKSLSKGILEDEKYGKKRRNHSCGIVRQQEHVVVIAHHRDQRILPHKNREEEMTKETTTTTSSSSSTGGGGRASTGVAVLAIFCLVAMMIVCFGIAADAFDVRSSWIVGKMGVVLLGQQQQQQQRVVAILATVAAVSAGTARVIWKKKGRRRNTSRESDESAVKENTTTNNNKNSLAFEMKKEENNSSSTARSSQPGSPTTPPTSSSKPASSSSNVTTSGKKSGRNKGGAKDLKIDDEALEEFKLQQERLKNERLERERMIFEHEEAERIAREAKEKELIEKRRLRALEHEAELEKLRLARLAKKEEEEKKKLEEEAKNKAKESSYNNHNDMHQEHQHHVTAAHMYHHQHQHHHRGGPTNPKQIPSPHFNVPKPPPGPPPEHVVRAVKAKQQMASAAPGKINEPPLPSMAPIHLDELHKDKAAQREVSKSAMAPPGFGSGSVDHSLVGAEDRSSQPANLLVHQRMDSFASDGPLNDVLGLTFSSLGDDVFGPFEDEDDATKVPLPLQQVHQQNVASQPPLPPGPPPTQPHVLAAQQTPNNTEVREWLRMLNLEQFAEIFERESIVMSDLVLLRERDLESLGLPLGPRRRIAASVAYMSTTTTASTNTNSSNTAASTNGASNGSTTPPPPSLSRGDHARSPSKEEFVYQNQMLYHGCSASDGLFEVDVDDLVPVVEEEPSVKEPSPIMVEAAAKIKIASATMKVPQEFYDCITCEVMLEPVITSDGHSYDRNSIARWLEKHDTSPITGEKLAQKKLTLNHSLRSSILAFADDYCAPLPRE